MKTLKEIKNKVAKEMGWASSDFLLKTAADEMMIDELDKFVNKVSFKVAEASLEKASLAAKTKLIDKDFTVVKTPTMFDVEIDKDTITDKKNIITVVE